MSEEQILSRKRIFLSKKVSSISREIEQCKVRRSAIILLRTKRHDDTLKEKAEEVRQSLAYLNDKLRAHESCLQSTIKRLKSLKHEVEETRPNTRNNEQQ